MRILFVTDYPPEEIIGGSVRVLYEQCTRLAERNHDIHILTRRENFRNGFDIPKTLTIWKYATDIKNHYSLFFSTLKNSRALFDELIDKFEYDLINFHQPFSAAGVLRSPKSYLVKKIYTCHSLSFEEYWSRNKKSNMRLRYFLYALNGHMRKSTEKYVLKKSDKILALSEHTKFKLSKVYKIPFGKCIVTSGGVDLERFCPSNNKIELRMKLNIPEDKIILFTVRNLVNRMGLENLITALTYVVQEEPDIHLILGGEGPLKKSLLSLTNELGLKDHIRFLGFIPEQELPQYYQLADFFILPTYELEGFGLVTLEAMASGLPVLGTPVGGTKEILGHFNPKFLFQDASPMSIATLILEYYRKIKENPYEWNNISRRCRQFVECHYSWEKNVDTIENLFLRQLG